MSERRDLTPSPAVPIRSHVLHSFSDEALGEGGSGPHHIYGPPHVMVLFY